ncbi:MAG: hypothetical protein ACXV0U_07830, partial [Kineosporiaceae bacterium]
MTTPHDPFEAGQREALRSTDALLDRLGARTPTPGDLDDPVVAALALMAAEIDLDAVAVDATRVAAERAFPDVTPGIGRTLSAPAAPAPGGAGSGLVIDLRDYPGYSHAREALRRR